MHTFRDLAGHVREGRSTNLSGLRTLRQNETLVLTQARACCIPSGLTYQSMLV